MKKLFYISLLILFSSSLNAQWVQCEGIYGGTVYTVYSNSNFVISGTDFGVYITSNNGSTWIQTDLNNESVLSLTGTGSIVLAGTYNGVYRSTNYGLNWTPTALTNTFVNSMALSSNYLLALTSGISRSTNF